MMYSYDNIVLYVEEDRIAALGSGSTGMEGNYSRSSELEGYSVIVNASEEEKEYSGSVILYKMHILMATVLYLLNIVDKMIGNRLRYCLRSV